VELRECRRVLSEGGVFVVGFRPKTEQAESEFPPSIFTFRTVEQVSRLLPEAGFSDVTENEYRADRRVVALVRARS